MTDANQHSPLVPHRQHLDRTLIARITESGGGRAVFAALVRRRQGKWEAGGVYFFPPATEHPSIFLRAGASQPNRAGGGAAMGSLYQESSSTWRCYIRSFHFVHTDRLGI